MSFEETFNENVSLRKMLNLAKLGLDKTEADYAHLKEMFESLSVNYEKLSNEYDRLQKHTQSNLSERLQVERFLQGRVEQLRQLVEQKQRQIQEIQIKVIPNLDQDMIRVKLISEMEGPYQQSLTKKDNEIQQLQKRLHESERKLSLINLQVEYGKQQREQEASDLKLYYEAEISRLSVRLDGLVTSSQGREKDKQLVRKLRKDVEQARALLQLKDDESKELRREKDALREDISHMIIKLSSKNTNESSEKALYQVEMHKLSELLKSRDAELDRLSREVSKQRESNRQLSRKAEDLNSGIDRMRDEQSNRQRSIKELQDKIKRLSQDREDTRTTNTKLQREIDVVNTKLSEKSEQFNRLREKLSTQRPQDKENLEFNYNEKMEEFDDNKGKAVKWARLQSQLKDTIAELRRENKLLKQELQQASSRKSPRLSPEHTVKPHSERPKILEQKIKILKKKLQEANNKIMQLLKEKISQQPTPESGHLYGDIPIGTRYEARDAALVPLVQPSEFDMDLSLYYPRVPPMMLPERIPPIPLSGHIPIRQPMNPYRPIDDVIYRPY